MTRARSAGKATPRRAIVAPPGPLALELPVIAPGTQAYTCSVSCGGACCKYFSLPIETPTSDRDFDDVRWYLMHEDTHVYRLEGAWYLLMFRRCRYLRADNLCGNYEGRPETCREYDPTDCEFTGPVKYEAYFRDDRELVEWLAERKRLRRRKLLAKRATGRTTVTARKAKG